METPAQVESFGFNWTLAVSQIVFIFWLGLAIYATFLAGRAFRGWLLFGWMCFCWLIPLIGPLVVIFCARKELAKASAA